MDVFTDAYDKSVELLRTPSLHADWKSIEQGLKTLLEVGGPSVNSAPCLDELRKQLTANKGKTTTAKAMADEIIRASRPTATGYQDRAASGNELWTLQVYKTEYDPREEKDVQDVYIEEMRVDAKANALILRDERGRRFSVNLTDRSVTQKR